MIQIFNIAHQRTKMTFLVRRLSEKIKTLASYWHLKKLILADFLISFFCLFKKKVIQKKTILLIRLDAIGDYVLFRNFIEILAKSEVYRGYKITLVGRDIWCEVAKNLDSKHIDKFIWINEKKFYSSLIYRIRITMEIAKHGYEVIIQPTFSRFFWREDFIVLNVFAKCKIGNSGDLSNISVWQKEKSDGWYTHLIPARNDFSFEFFRNRDFFESLLKTKIDLKNPFICLPKIKLDFALPERFAVLFIGASTQEKKWRIDNFAKIGKFLRENIGLSIVVCGGKAEIKELAIFKKYYEYDFLDLVGKTSLIVLANILNKAKILVSNDTCAPHFAMALQTQVVIVISNGTNYERFSSYPKITAKEYQVVYPPPVEKQLRPTHFFNDNLEKNITVDVNDVTTESVLKRIIPLLKKCNSSL